MVLNIIIKKRIQIALLIHSSFDGLKGIEVVRIWPFLYPPERAKKEYAESLLVPRMCISISS